MIVKMAVVQTFHVIYGRFNIAVICINENCTVYTEINQWSFQLLILTLASWTLQIEAVEVK